MTCNVGGADRAVRWILTAVFVIAGFAAPVEPGWRIALFVLGGIAFFTALTTYCPLNQVLGINTCRKGP